MTKEKLLLSHIQNINFKEIKKKWKKNGVVKFQYPLKAKLVINDLKSVEFYRLVLFF